MKREEIEAFLAEWQDAWRRRDAVALTAPYSEDAVYTSMLAGTIRGHQAIESLYRSWFLAFPEMAFQVDSQLIDGAKVAVFWSHRGRHLGDFCGLAGTGRIFVLHGVFLMTLQEGRITSMLSLYDFTGLLLQIGVLKAKPAI
jgi:steroid delta-isomerase-like uncharacterized protein